jgi:hypothetical protein
MMKSGAVPKALLQHSTTLGAGAGAGAGAQAARLSRPLPAFGRRSQGRAVFRPDALLSGFVQAADADPWHHERPVPEQVLRYASEFLAALPSTVPEPLICRDDEGMLAFEWVGGDGRMLRVRLSPDGMLLYAGRLGARRRVSGAEPIGDVLPPLIRHAILQVARSS